MTTQKLKEGKLDMTGLGIIGPETYFPDPKRVGIMKLDEQRSRHCDGLGKFNLKSTLYATPFSCYAPPIETLICYSLCPKKQGAFSTKTPGLWTCYYEEWLLVSTV